MNNNLHARQRVSVVVGSALLLLVPVVQAKVLIDFGNDLSYRCHSTANPDVNGNYWNSVWSGAYYSNMINADGTPGTMAFGFGTTVGGVDSYNGPAGATDAQGTPNDMYTNAFVNTVALGDLGIQSAVFDFYVSSTFTIQNLDPTKLYHLTFYGSHMYNTDNTTVYTVYTSNDYATAVASNSLLVGVANIFNADKVVTISNISPQFANSIWIRFQGSAGGSGYLNAMRIEMVPEPGLVCGLLAGLLLAVRKLRG